MRMSQRSSDCSYKLQLTEWFHNETTLWLFITHRAMPRTKQVSTLVETCCLDRTMGKCCSYRLKASVHEGSSLASIAALRPTTECLSVFAQNEQQLTSSR